MRAVAVGLGLAAIGVAGYALFGATNLFGDSTVGQTSIGQKTIIPTADIVQYALAAGFDSSNILDAVAVALAESGGNTNAYNPESDYFTRHNIADTEQRGSYGLWQIFKFAHPEFANLDLTNPQTNANAAFSVYVKAGYSFRPWSTYTSGAYEAHLDDAQSGYNMVAGICSGSCQDCLPESV